MTIDRERCGGKLRQGEGTCGQQAGWGTTHVGAGRCKLHGGGTETHRKNAELAAAQKRANTMFGKHVVVGPVHNPLDVYAQLTGEVIGWKDALGQLVRDLTGPGYRGATGEQIRAEVQLFERALDRCNTVLSTYARLGIDERLARISEAQSAMVLAALDAGLAAVGVVGQRAVEAKRAAAKRLRVIEGATAEGPATP